MIMRNHLSALFVGLCLIGGNFACSKDKENEASKAKEAASSAPSTAAIAAPEAKKGASASATALSHLPSGCQLVFSLDLKKAQEDPLVAKHLKFPIPEDLAEDRKKAGKDELAAQKAMEALSITSPKQLHQVAACITELENKSGEPKAYALVMSGEFKKGADLEAVAQTAGGAVSGKRSRVKIGSIDALKNEKEGLFFAQATDGVIVISNDEDLLQASYGSSDAHKKYGVSKTHHLSLLIKAALAKNAAASGGAQSPFSQITPGDIRIFGSLSGKLEGEIEMESAKDAASAVAALKLMQTQFSAHPDATMKAVAGSIVLKAEDKSVRLEINLPKDLTIKMLESYSAMSEDVQKKAQ